jgi:hypothetical protein
MLLQGHRRLAIRLAIDDGDVGPLLTSNELQRDACGVQGARAAASYRLSPQFRQLYLLLD